MHAKDGVNRTQTTIVLSPNLEERMQDVFHALGFLVVWEENIDKLRARLRGQTVDVAMEWQRSAHDYRLRDMFRVLGYRPWLVLAMNFNRETYSPDELKRLGYDEVMDVPFSEVALRRLMARSHGGQSHE